jgi:chromosome partitioning protein
MVTAIMAIANHKGGVGKTTTAVNLAASLAEKGKRTLLIDLDSQSNATQWLIGTSPDPGNTIYEVLLEKKKLIECITQTDSGVDLVASNLLLASIEIQLHQKLNGYKRLDKALRPILNSYDYVLIDCPPNLGMVTINALVTANIVVVPVECKAEAYKAVPQLMLTLNNILEDLDQVDKALVIYGLPTFLERSKLAQDIHEQLKEKFGYYCLPPIHKNITLAESFAATKPINRYDRTAVGRVDYLRVTEEIINDQEKTLRGQLEKDIR